MPDDSLPAHILHGGRVQPCVSHPKTRDGPSTGADRSPGAGPSDI